MRFISWVIVKQEETKMAKLNILVLGLKTFGVSIVKQLYEYNCDVLAIDKDMDRIEEVVDYATEAVQIDIRKNGSKTYSIAR